MNLQEILEKAAPRPWGDINGPSPGINECDDGGDYAIGRKGGIFLEAIHKIGPGCEADAHANILIARHAANNFEPMLEVLRELRRALQQAEALISADVWEQCLGDETVRANSVIRQAEEVRDEKGID